MDLGGKLGARESTRPFVPEFRAVFEAAPRPLLLIIADAPKYTMVAANPAHASAFGTTPEALVGLGVLEVLPVAAGPEVARFADSVRLSFEEVLRTRRQHQMPVNRYPVTQGDGQVVERFWAATNVPLFSADGAVTHILSACQDVTGEVLERRTEQARDLLMREVDHRARNALTVVQSFVRLMKAETVEAFRRVLEGRIASLARAQTSLAAQRWEGGKIRDIVEAELHAMSPDRRHHLAGSEVLLPPDQVQAMTMLVHELATNASKYGALSVNTGELAVDWARQPDDRVVFTWAETGGPRVTPPSAEGFGTRLIQQLARQLCGTVELDWRPDGLRAVLAFSLPGDR
ncbi:MAG TPA: HWE histidine kinase domain-containing protein [Phenylobacterium sp.]|nr:HWE histidine kinase domain-containing protein [Phenylobacterium sp.]